MWETGSDMPEEQRDTPASTQGTLHSPTSSDIEEGITPESKRKPYF